MFKDVEIRGLLGTWKLYWFSAIWMAEYRESSVREGEIGNYHVKAEVRLHRQVG